MQLNLSTHPPDRQKHKCLVLGYFSDEKPPRGICGLMDWRLNGMISWEIKQGHINGEFKEKVVIPYPQRIGSELLFLFGLGNLTDLSYDRIYTVAYEIAGAIDAMKLREFAFDLPGEGRSELTTAGMLEAMMTGFFDFLSNDVSKLANVSICLLTSSERLAGVEQGIAQFHKNVRHMGLVDFSAVHDESPS
ncbi:MAG: hypothetical protein Q8O28_04725 [Smithellaceae bacterium]|nr:hypothetical protein [Smithellaceae bacterium]